MKRGDPFDYALLVIVMVVLAALLIYPIIQFWPV